MATYSVQHVSSLLGRCACRSMKIQVSPSISSSGFSGRRRCLSTGQSVNRPRKRLKLRWIILAFGSGVFLNYSYKKLTRKQDEPKLATNRQVSLYRRMPFKTMSRAWGKFNELDLPVFLRKPLLGLYIWMFGVKLHEAEDEELKNYRNLSEFFRRKLKSNVRLVDQSSALTCPSDGRILHFGKVEKGVVEQVKGVNYELKGFLGSPTWSGVCQEVDENDNVDSSFHDNLRIQPGNALYHCIIYLAPGDYHRFHSAADWQVTYRRHFPGELLSVNPGVARWIRGLFSFNERVVYCGSWQYGFFSYTAVGATNVGSIKIYIDQDLQTNTTSKKYPDGEHFDKRLDDEHNKGIAVKKGEMFGEFNLGSTIVLVFEAPENFQFTVRGGQKVQFGQSLGKC